MQLVKVKALLILPILFCFRITTAFAQGATITVNANQAKKAVSP